jgi:hypothetical protein
MLSSDNQPLISGFTPAKRLGYAVVFIGLVGAFFYLSNLFFERVHREVRVYSTLRGQSLDTYLAGGISSTEQLPVETRLRLCKRQEGVRWLWPDELKPNLKRSLTPMAKIVSITEQFQQFLTNLKESFWGDLEQPPVRANAGGLWGAVG